MAMFCKHVRASISIRKYTERIGLIGSCVNLTGMRSELEYTNWIIAFFFFGKTKRERERARDKNVHKRSGLSFGLQAVINGLSRAEAFSMTSRSQMAYVTHS